MVYLPKRRRNYHLVGGFDPDALDYFSAAGITNLVEQSAWNAFVKDMKAQDLWERFDRIYPFSPTSASAALYCAKTLNQMTAHGAVWSTNGYETNDGKGFYLETDLSGAGPKMAIDSMSIIANLFDANVAIFGWNTISGIFQTPSSANRHELYFEDDLAVEVGALNANVSLVSSSTYGNPTSGFFAFSRRNNLSCVLVVGSELQDEDSSTTVSGSIPSLNWFIGARNQNGTAIQEYDGQFIYNFFALGGGFTESELSEIRVAVDAYNAEVR